MAVVLVGAENVPARWFVTSVRELRRRVRPFAARLVGAGL